MMSLRKGTKLQTRGGDILTIVGLGFRHELLNKATGEVTLYTRLEIRHEFNNGAMQIVK